jgi:hypothetical protein
MIEITLNPTLSQCIRSIAKTEYEHALHTLLKKGKKATISKKSWNSLDYFWNQPILVNYGVSMKMPFAMERR